MLGIAGIVLYAVFGIVTTHDYMELMRNQLAVTDWLEKRSIPRSKISGGMEYDLYTQIQERGHLNDRRIKNPPGAFRKSPTPLPPTIAQDPTLARLVGFWAWFTPDVHPEYFVTHNIEIPGKQPVYTRKYRLWLPPKTQRVDAYFVPEIEELRTQATKQ